jgi:hypothetical protein
MRETVRLHAAKRAAPISETTALHKKKSALHTQISHVEKEAALPVRVQPLYMHVYNFNCKINRTLFSCRADRSHMFVSRGLAISVGLRKQLKIPKATAAKSKDKISSHLFTVFHLCVELFRVENG